MDGAAGVFLLLILVAFAAAMYFLPTIIALIRHHQVGSVAVLNTFLGWTFIGWIVSMAMAAGSRPKAIQINIDNSGNVGNTGNPGWDGRPQQQPTGYQTGWQQNQIPPGTQQPSWGSQPPGELPPSGWQGQPSGPYQEPYQAPYQQAPYQESYRDPGPHHQQ